MQEDDDFVIQIRGSVSGELIAEIGPPLSNEVVKMSVSEFLERVIRAAAGEAS